MLWVGGELSASTRVTASLKKGESAFLHDFNVVSRKTQLLQGLILIDCLPTKECAEGCGNCGAKAL